MSCDIIVKETVKSGWVLPGTGTPQPAGMQGRVAGRKRPVPCRPSAEASGSGLVGFLTSIDKGDFSFSSRRERWLSRPVVSFRGGCGTELMSARQLQFLFTFLSASESLPGESSPWREAKTNVLFLTTKFCPLLNSSLIVKNGGGPQDELLQFSFSRGCGGGRVGCLGKPRPW